MIVCYDILWYSRLCYDVLKGPLLPSGYIVALPEAVINMIRNKTMINTIDDMISETNNFIWCAFKNSLISGLPKETTHSKEPVQGNL